jgi:glycosyltransferase involved in cell wall biosynthesis
VCLISTSWAPADNQYRLYLRQHGVPFFQAPRWLYQLAADWPTKLRVLAWLLAAAWPLMAAGGLALMLFRRQTPRQAFASARGRLSNALLKRLLEPIERRRVARGLLTWCNWRWRPDLLHLQGYTSALLFALDWANEHRLPVVYTEHQTPDPQLDWWQDFDKNINKATVIVAVSQASADALRAVCQIRRPLFTTSPIMADPLADGRSLAPRAVPAGEPLNVNTVARLGYTKGLTYLLEAVRQVQSEFPNARFRVYGDGPLRAELLDYAAQLGLAGEDIFVGPFTGSELPRIMAETDIFLMSSVLEGLPLALLEALAYGRAIVATTAGGNAEVVADGVSGLLCPPRDAACLSAQLRRLLADGQLRLELGRAARQAYEQGPYTPRAVAQRHLEIYRAALQQPAAEPAGAAASTL